MQTQLDLAERNETQNETQTELKNEQQPSNKTLKEKNAFKRSELIFVWGWLALPIIKWIIFYWGTNITSFIGAFQDPITSNFSMTNFQQVWDSMWTSKSLDSLKVAFENTLKYFLTNNLIKLPIQLITCYFLYKQIKGYKLYRFILYLPAILPGVAMAAVFKEMVSSGGVLEALGFPIPANGLLGMPETATNTILVYTVWTGICGNMLLYCGAMHRIPVEVLEAARIDGIGPWKEFIYLILPMIWPTLSTCLVLACCDFLSASGPILLLASDSYSLRSTTISYWIWSKVYAGGVQGAGQYNLVSAAGLLLTAIAVPTVLLIRKAFDMIPSVEY